jgi:hypothetical protein
MQQNRCDDINAYLIFFTDIYTSLVFSDSFATDDQRASTTHKKTTPKAAPGHQNDQQNMLNPDASNRKVQTAAEQHVQV